MAQRSFWRILQHFVIFSIHIEWCFSTRILTIIQPTIFHATVSILVQLLIWGTNFTDYGIYIQLYYPVALWNLKWKLLVQSRAKKVMFALGGPWVKNIVIEIVMASLHMTRLFNDRCTYVICSKTPCSHSMKPRLLRHTVPQSRFSCSVEYHRCSHGVLHMKMAHF